MSYVKQTWATGDVITAEKLNHMEDGIETNSSDAQRLAKAVNVNDYPIVPVVMVFSEDRGEITLPFEFSSGNKKAVELWVVVPDATKEYIGTFQLSMQEYFEPNGYRIELLEYPVIYYEDGFKVGQLYGKSELSNNDDKFVFLSQLTRRIGAIPNAE